MKNNILYSLFFLLTLVACSKEEENVNPIPITDLPCEEQGTYFLSATIGDSAFCYASDSSFDEKYIFVGSIKDLSGYYGKDTSILIVPINHYNNNELILSITYHIPIYSRYEMKPFISIVAPFYDRRELEKNLDNKTYPSQNINNPIWGNTPDFYVGVTKNNYNDTKGSYFGHQDSSYIHLFNPVYLFDTPRNGNVIESIYRVSYEAQTNPLLPLAK